MSVAPRDRRFNFLVCLIDAIGFPIGIAFFSLQTIFPTFLRHCGAGDITIGALTALNGLVVFLPGLLVVPYLRRLKRVRGYLFWVALVERLALLPIAPLALWWGAAHPTWLVAGVFVCFFFHSLAMGVNMPAYWMLVGKVVPERWRGRLFGYAGGLAGLVGIGVDWLMTRVVFSGPDQGFPDGYARGFVIGFTMLTVTIVPFLWAREPLALEPDAPEERRLSRAVLEGLWRDDPPFRRFLQGQILYMLTALAGPFLVLHAQSSLGAPDTAVARYTGITVYAGAFGSLLVGYLADRLGNRPVLAGSIAVHLVGFAAAFWISDHSRFALVFLLVALAGAGVGIAGNNLVMEYAGDPRRIGLYTSYYNLVTALPRAAAPLLGGALAGALGYRGIFALGGVLALGAMLLLLRPARVQWRSEEMPP